MSEKWESIGSGSACVGCGGVIEAETPFYSVLTAETEDLKRFDYCPACWERRAGEESGGPVIASWRTVRAPREAPKRTYVKLDMDVVWRIFSSMDEGPEAGIEAELRYVLALMLLRRRRLELGKSVGGRLEMIAKKEERVFRVVDPDLSEERVQEVTDRLGELLWEREFAGLETS